MTKKNKPGSNLLRNSRFFLLFSFTLLFILSVFLVSTKILAEGTETPHITENYSHNDGKNTSFTSAAMEEEFAVECLWLACDHTIAIATRQETPVSKSPGIVTVITAEEIKNLGYRTFVEILRTIPGFEILKKGDYGRVVTAIRGLEAGNRLRLMLNGHLVNDPRTGSPFWLFDDFPVENIKKIEVIRGPGSAMYGENALLSVINIVTKDAKDINGVRVSSGYGSYDTYDDNIIFGETYGKVDISGMVRYRETKGFDGTVERDNQTILDNALHTSASQAPGSVEDWRREYDINLKAVYKDIYVEGLYINKNQGPFISPQYALNDESDVGNNYVFIDTGYKKTFDDRFTLKPRIYYDQFDINLDIESLPEGTTIPVGTNLYRYNDGLLGHVKASTKIIGTEIPFDYELFYGNIITLGFEYRLINLTNIYTSTSFHPKTMEPLPSVQNFSDSYPFYDDITRRVGSVYLQDTWDVTDTINLTLGGRYDSYSDFGGTISPRSGLTWAFMQNASLKLLYGEAFRAPSFYEMYPTNQPAIIGNNDLDPEIIRTYETGITYRFNKYVTSGVNYFYNDIQDLIALHTSPTTQNTTIYDNFGDALVQGVEMETRVDIKDGTYLFMNYTFQDPEDDDGHDLPFVAEHKGNFGVNVHYWKYMNTNLSTFVSGKRSRSYSEENDPKNPYEPRDKLPAYALLNLSVIAKEFYRTMEVYGTVFNLLDKDYSDPGPTSIPEDFPRPGRTFFVGLSYQF